MYMRLSTLTPRSSGICCLHLSRKVAISSPFLHCRQSEQREIQLAQRANSPLRFFGAHFRPSKNRQFQSPPFSFLPVVSAILVVVPPVDDAQCPRVRAQVRKTCPPLVSSYTSCSI